MTRRRFTCGELLLALLAVKHASIDLDELISAVQSCVETDDRTLAEILLGHGLIDPSSLAAIEVRAAASLRNSDRLAGDKPIAAGSSGSEPEVATMTGARSLSATVAHVGLRRDARDRIVTEDRDQFAAADGRFRIVRPLAHGGLGELYLALDPELDRHVALKELRAFHAHEPTSQSRFLLEARVTGRLEHPGIVPVYGVGRYADGRPYYAMRLIEGETLEQAIERFHAAGDDGRASSGRQLDLRRLLGSFVDACNAVAYAHSRGVVHRDIKPANIMLGPFGETIVVDWGIAKPLVEITGESADELSRGTVDEHSSLTRPGTAIGTPQYMSPEQAGGDLARVDRASDIYSLGATLYCLLTGRGPFASGSVADVLDQVRRGIFPSPRRVRRSVDPSLESICLKAMSLEQEDRHPSALALAGEIEAWLAEARFRGEHERAHGDVKRSFVRLCIERAHNLFAREKPGEGMLWLSRALGNLPSDSAGIEHVVRSSLSGWHGATKLLERTLAHGAGVRAVRFSPDGRRLATTCDDQCVRLWDMAKGALLSSPIRHDQTIRALAFSHDGDVIATASVDGLVSRFDGMTGAAIGDPIRHEGATSAHFSHDGKRIATAGRGGQILLWETATGRPIGAAARLPAEVTSIAFHPDGGPLAAAGSDGRVRFVEMETGKLLTYTLEHDSPACATSFSPNGERLLCAYVDGRLKLWDIPNRVIIADLPHRPEVGCAGWSQQGHRLITACDDGSARIWDADSGKPVGEPLTHQGRVICFGFNPDGTMAATGSDDGTVRLWGADTGLPIGPPLEHRGTVNGLVLSSDRRRLATACSDGMARCWRVPVPIAGDVERIESWVRVVTQLDFDPGDAIGPIDQMTLWELRRRLHELGGAPVK